MFNSGTGSIEKDFWQPPPFGKPFVGRGWELAELDRFLNDTSAEAKPIMLVYGQRGVGKSALVREAAQRARERGTFKTVAWLDRTRAAEVFDEEGQELLPTLPGIPNLERFTQENQYGFVDRFRSKRQTSGDLPVEAIEFLKEVLKHQPFLLVVDDFDEYDNLGNSYSLCVQLARVQSPNKVILTTRWLQHKFAQAVYEDLEIGLLVEDDARQLVHRSNLSRLDPDRLVERDLDATIEYVWKKSGGLPEFITRFLIPVEEHKKWLMEDPKWSDMFQQFSAGYLTQREQEQLPENHEENYNDNVRACEEKFRRLGLMTAETCDSATRHRRYVLLQLLCEREAVAMETRDVTVQMVEGGSTVG